MDLKAINPYGWITVHKRTIILNYISIIILAVPHIHLP